MLDLGASVMAKDNRSSTPVHTASKYRHAELCRELLRRDSDPLVVGDEGLTPLHIACSSCDPEITLVLLNAVQGALPTDSRLQTPLHVAAHSGQPNVFQVVLDHYLECWGKSSIKVCRLALEELLLGIDDLGFNVLHTAAWSDNVSLVEEILIRPNSHDYGESITSEKSPSLKHRLLTGRNVKGDCPLHVAVRHRYLPIIQTLCRVSVGLIGVDLRSALGLTPLHYACLHNFGAGMLELLSFGAEIDAVDSRNCTPLILACETSAMGTARLLVEKGATLLAVEGGSSALHKATQHGDEDLGKELLKLAVERGVRSLRRLTDNKGRYPMTLAARRCSRRHELVLRMLSMRLLRRELRIWLTLQSRLQRQKSSPSVGVIPGLYDRPLLHLACEHRRALRVLVKAGFGIDAKDDNGMTALSLAVRGGYTDAAWFLLENDADPRAGDATGKTPLHYAATFMWEDDPPTRRRILYGEMLELLLRYVAPTQSMDIAGDQGDTPLSDAVALGGDLLYANAVGARQF